MDNGNVFKRFLNEMKIDANNCLSLEEKQLTDIGEKVLNAISILEETSDTLLNMWKNNKRQAASGATPFIDMCGYIFGGWMMAKSAHKASCLIKNDEKNKFLHAKIDTAAFYSNTVLESSLSLKNVVINAHKNVDSILKNNHKN
jgi:hypothetical protein